MKIKRKSLMRHRCFAKTLAAVMTCVVAITAMIIPTSAARNTRTFNLSSGWNNIAPGVTLNGATEIALNKGDHLGVNLTFTLSSNLATVPSYVEFGMYNMSTGVFTKFEYYMGNGGGTMNSTHILGVTSNGIYKFRVKNTLGVTVSVSGSFTYNKPTKTYCSQGGLENRTVRIQRIRDSSISVSKYEDLFVPAILSARDVWNSSGAGISITTTTAEEPHKLKVGFYDFDGFWDGMCYKSPAGDVVTTSSNTYINDCGPSVLGLDSASKVRKRKAVIVHEIGHLFWLDNNPTKGSQRSIMHYDDLNNDSLPYTPSEFDVNNVKFRYH